MTHRAETESAVPSGGLQGPLILVVAYRSGRFLAGCLLSLHAGANVVVVDNSADPEIREITAGAGARYLPSSTNLGFAGAVNLGLRHAWDGNRDVLLLNPDARVSGEGVQLLQQALHAAGHKRAAVGPRLVDEAGNPQPPEWAVPSPGQVWLDALGASRWWRGPTFVVGAVILLRAEALAELGGLDERFFLYAEEADWQLRALRAGWEVAIVAESVAVHVGAASSANEAVRTQMFQASAQKFARKWYGRVGARIMWVGSVVGAARRSVVGQAESRRSGRRTMRALLSHRGAGRSG